MSEVLIIDGDSVADSGSRAICELAARGAGGRALVGGLGLGYLTRALRAQPAVTGTETVEILRGVVDAWRAAGEVDTVDHRVTLGDVRARVGAAARAGQPYPWDSVILHLPGEVVTNPRLHADLQAVLPSTGQRLVLIVWDVEPPRIPGFVLGSVVEKDEQRIAYYDRAPNYSPAPYARPGYRRPRS